MCEDYTSIEQRLLEYSILTLRINSLIEETTKSTLRNIALKLGPSDIKTSDMSKQRMQTSSPQDWIYYFEKECAKMTAQTEGMKQEIYDCLEKQENIRMMVDAADLSEKQKLYVQLRYYQGKLVKVVASEMGYNNTESLKKIRREALKKIIRNI